MSENDTIDVLTTDKHSNCCNYPVYEFNDAHQCTACGEFCDVVEEE